MVAKRNLLKIRRVPDVLVGTLVAPIMFIVLFRYVFGGAIGGSLPGGVPYAEFLIPGIFAQTVVFGATTTGSGLADDMQKGIIDRFRSLPMSRMAVLVGRTTSDLLTNVIVVVIMTVTGLVVGWRIHSSPLEALAAFALFLLFAYALSWVMAFVGLIIRSPEAFNQLSFLVIFPITFIADTFASSATFPAPLRVFAEWNPITSLVRAGSRALRQHRGRARADRLVPRGAPAALHPGVGGGGPGGVRAAGHRQFQRHHLALTRARRRGSRSRCAPPARDGAPHRGDGLSSSAWDLAPCEV